MPQHVKEFGNAVGPLGFPMPDKQARGLELLLKALPKESEYEYQRRVTTKATTELNPGERSDVSWISSESVDRYGDVVVSKGMNDGQFQGNPLVTLGHNYYLPPVGKSLWRKRIKDGDLTGIKAKTQYPSRPAAWAEADPWPPDKVFALVQAGMLQGKSIGFQPVKLHFADEQEAKKKGWPEGTLVFDEWLLLEYACCFLPANQDALVEAVSKGLEIPAELLQAMGVDGSVFRKAPPPLATPVAGPIAFTALSEVERAVESTLAGIDFGKMAESAIKEGLAKRQGRI